MVVSVGKQRGLRDSVTAARVSAITTGVLDEDVHCHCHCLLGRCSRGPVRWCWWLRGKRQDTDMRQGRGLSQM